MLFRSDYDTCVSPAAHLLSHLLHLCHNQCTCVTPTAHMSHLLHLCLTYCTWSTPTALLSHVLRLCYTYYICITATALVCHTYCFFATSTALVMLSCFCDSYQTFTLLLLDVYIQCMFSSHLFFITMSAQVKWAKKCML